MASAVVVSACPHCQKSLKIPSELLGRTVRCKGCSNTFTADADLSPRPEKADASDKKTPPKKVQMEKLQPVAMKAATAAEHQADKDVSYINRMASQQRSSNVLFLAIVLLAIGTISAGFVFFKDKIFAAFNKAASQTQATRNEAQTSLLITANEKLDERSGDLTQLQDSAPARKNRRNLARIPAPYPGRALLIGIRNYLYLNPLNPGYRSERSFQQDPLGLINLRRVLTTELSFPREQVLLLSDVDDHQPTVPTKETLQANISEFLTGCQPAQRVVLTLCVHTCRLGGKTYLIPVDGELPSEGAKPDPERDARLSSNMIPLSWLYEKLANCPARQKLLILDIAQNDPEAGVIRQASGPITEEMMAELKDVPVGVQLWLPCQPKQFSYGFNSSGQNGTVFMDTLCQLATLSIDRNWKLIEKDPALKTGSLPLVSLASHVGSETSKYLQDRDLEQLPQLLGQEKTADTTVAALPENLPALKLVLPAQKNELLKTQDLVMVLQEIGMESDPARRISPSSFPPLMLAAFAKYHPDYKSAKELAEKLNQWPVRAMTVKAIRAIDRSMKSFKTRFVEESDETAFKKRIEKEQETPAIVTAQLSDILEEMKALSEKRNEELSLRWQAHFDFTQARLLAQLAHVQEYSFVLGNKLRKDTPKIKDAKNHNGWIIVPQRKLEQKETRTFDAERQKLLSKIIKDHPGTPWEILARREQATILGLTLQETFLEEGKPLARSK